MFIWEKVFLLFKVLKNLFYVRRRAAGHGKSKYVNYDGTFFMLCSMNAIVEFKKEAGWSYSRTN